MNDFKWNIKQDTATDYYFHLYDTANKSIPLLLQQGPTCIDTLNASEQTQTPNSIDVSLCENAEAKNGSMF
ncbi:hypothetical protein Hanom_Chr06g00498101 [Helianthus anomalus]